MTKDELFDRWIDDFHDDYFLSGVIEIDREDFYTDLEAWYTSRHVKELDAIKQELMKTLGEMDAAVAEFGSRNNKIAWDHALTFGGRGEEGLPEKFEGRSMKIEEAVEYDAEDTIRGQ